MTPTGAPADNSRFARQSTQALVSAGWHADCSDESERRRTRTGFIAGVANDASTISPAENVDTVCAWRRLGVERPRRGCHELHHSE